MMLYDKDIYEIEVKHGKVYLEYFCPTEGAIFTREDLLFLLKKLDEEGKCQHDHILRETIRDIANQCICSYEICPDCGYKNEARVGTPLT